MNNKSPIIAFLLAFFPGAGLLYLKKIRGIFYTFAVFGFLFSTILFGINYESFLMVVSIFLSIILYVINFIDTVITAAKIFQNKPKSINDAEFVTPNPQSERFFAIILSVMPGLGHFQLGLINRGFTLLVGFIGLNIMVFFVTFLTGREEFLLFIAFSLIIWIYSFFDVMQLLKKKDAGEELIDQSILEELEKTREVGKKSKAIATFLSVFPGAGHLYLGLQKRGIQLMAAFLLSIYVLDVLRLGLFLFLVPIIWFYSFFDGLQKASTYDQEKLEDKPIIANFINHQKWIGIGLILVGVYFIFSNVLIPSLAPIIESYFDIGDLRYYIQHYLQTIIVCILLIGGGIKLLTGNKSKKNKVNKEVTK